MVQDPAAQAGYQTRELIFSCAQRHVESNTMRHRLGLVVTCTTATSSTSSAFVSRLASST
jgi:hypothetical protein